MRQNFLWVVLLVNLLAIGAGVTYLAARPAEIRAMSPRFGELVKANSVLTFSDLQVQAAASTGTSRPPANQVAAATTPAPAKGPAPAKTPAATPAPRRTPPPKGSTKLVLPDETAPRAQAVYLGPHLQEIKTEPPAIALYPFRVSKRYYPEEAPNDLEIELLMLNASGIHWKDAYVVLKSADQAIPPQMFQVKEWRNDSLAVFHYRFPKRDKERRLQNLRVISVTGERRVSPLAEHMSGERSLLADRLAPDDPGTSTLDILGNWNETATAMRSGQLTTGTLPSLEIGINPSTLISKKTTAQLGADVPDREPILKSYNAAHAAALEMQTAIINFVEALNTQGYGYLQTDDGKAVVSSLKEAKNAYDQAGLDFMTRTGSSTDAEVKALRQDFTGMTDKLLTLIGAVESSIKSLDPTFSFEKL